ncbi:MAG TPA: sodium:solute symporter family protein [bacterium]|nr:sodium:solute symporter family protein [bacterium]HQL62173.1 sodium:solute symporter family protein [bacterium]
MNEFFLTNFSIQDWLIVAMYLVGVALAGILAHRYISNVSDYMVGGRGSGTALNIANYIATGLCLVTIMYASIESFRKGFSYMMIGLLCVPVGLFVGITGFVVRPLRSLQLLTIPEFFEKRFDKQTRVVAGAICALAGILNMGLFPKMGATFITYATGLGATGNAEMVNWVTSLMIVLVLIYTAMGGMVSVIVTDFIQFFILGIGMGVGMLFCLTHPDLGWTRIITALSEHRGEMAFNPFHPDSYGWLYMAWMAVVTVGATVCWGPEASRALTTKDEKTTKRTFLYSAPSALARTGIPAFWAIAAFCFYSQHEEMARYFFPDGLSGTPVHAEQAMPLFMGKIVPVGLLGVLTAGMMAAFMSTHSSYFLCWSSVIVRDVIGPLRRRPLSDKAQILITRFNITWIAIFLLVWGIWYKLPDSVWTYMAVTGNIYLSGSATILIGGIYWKRASKAGALAALGAGLLSIAGVFLEPIQRIVPWLSTELLGLGNYALCALLFIVVSLFFPDRKQSELQENQL